MPLLDPLLERWGPLHVVLFAILVVAITAAGADLVRHAVARRSAPLATSPAHLPAAFIPAQRRPAGQRHRT